MIIMKFGGSSVANPERIQNVLAIVRSRLDRNPVVVSSAFKGITDLLFESAQEALEGKNGKLETISDRHREMAEALGVDFEPVQGLISELGVLLRGISLVKELTPRTLDYVVSFGERMATRVIAAFFSEKGVPARQYDAFDIGMITDNHFGGAHPLPQAYDEIAAKLKADGEVPVVTGYIGKTKGGDITTLGRNGSDYTASILGAAVRAEEIQIWTDVDGVMTADPSICPDAHPIETMSFDEASELAYYGGRVLHPATIIPAVKRDIPVKVLNSYQPEAPGTTILSHNENGNGSVKSIVYHRDHFMVNIRSSRMLMGYGFLAKIFDIFGRYKIVVNMVSTSEVTVSVTTDRPDNLEEARADLEEFAEVSIENKVSVICVVGEGMRSTPGIAAGIFRAIGETGANVLMISQGGSKINMAFVVADEDTIPVVRNLHQQLFAKAETA